MTCSNIESYISNRKELVNSTLYNIFPLNGSGQTTLDKSVRHSIFAGGKRLRPILCLAACETFDKDYSRALPVACAIEMIHTYSFIHDDLPSMDDDDLRRGVPTNHKVYGEATAILAGDALLTDAFNLIVRNGRLSGIADKTLLDIIDDVSRAAGLQGMVKGQLKDMEVENNGETTFEELKHIHSLKTGSLIETSVISGALVGGAGISDLETLRNYSQSIGLAYQIIDDLIDDNSVLITGKTSGSDTQKNKPVFKRGDKSNKLVKELTNKAVLSLKNIDRDTCILQDLAEYLGQRNY